MSQPKLNRIGGLSAVSAVFARRPAQVQRLFFEPRMKERAEPFCKMLAAARKPFRQVEAEELAKVAGTPLHGGILALCDPLALPALEATKSHRWAKAGEPLVILDGIGNPHNLGAIIRTMAFFGLPRLVVSDHPGQALPSDAAFRVAEGGMEWVGMLRAPNLAAALGRLKPHYRVVGTALGAHRPVAEVLGRASGPIALVLGNEEDGLPANTLAGCDEVVTIAGSGQVQSLNVAATAAILINLLAGR